MKSSVFAALVVVCAIIVAGAQDTNTGGQAGSVMTDTTAADTTAPPSDFPVTTAPGMTAAANGIDPATLAPPSNVAPATEAPGPVWAANPAPMTDSHSGSFADTDDVESPVMKKHKKVTDSSQSNSMKIPSETSSAPIPIATTTAWTFAGLLGLVTML
ncbi:unnamed protein product [Peronospora belbahrii]|uniref:Uncharacterized protein n=1 Tax=Peronospora belbahrii TaxID=622444 RepID=A0AAU9L3H8_9STRA|nr:unnamed protein product [Peronospora belbahrii]CAH0514946.1 unnamed protein product [Peronospora belbahrii]